MTSVQDLKPVASRDPAAPAAMERQLLQDWDIIAALNLSLAHAIDLRSRTKQAYWSARGGNFYALHKMFDDFSRELDSISDDLAGRVMALRGLPAWTPHLIAKSSKLPTYPSGVISANDHLEALVRSYEAAASHVPAGMTRALRTGDHASANILASFASILDEHAGFIAAHLPQETLAATKKRANS